jgi:hypothetical protein
MTAVATVNEMSDEPRRPVCCSSPASMGYWLGVSVVAWGLLTFVGFFWHPLGPVSASTILIAMGIACVANWHRYRILHCGITAPLFIIAGTVFLLSDAQAIHVQPRFVWPFVMVGIVVAFLLEWRYARSSGVGTTANSHHDQQSFS